MSTLHNGKQLISDIKAEISKAKWQFEMAVEAAALEVTNIAKQISPAIGDISITEAKEAIIEEFKKRLLS